MTKPANPSAEQHWYCDRCAERVPHSDLWLQERIDRCDYSCTRSTCGGLMRWQPPASPSTVAPACESVVVRGDGSSTYTHADGRTTEYPAYRPQPIERCSCAESIRLRAALERLLADVEASKAEPSPRRTGRYAPAPPLLGGMSLEHLDYIIRIARRALALEPEGTP